MLSIAGLSVKIYLLCEIVSNNLANSNDESTFQNSKKEGTIRINLVPFTISSTSSKPKKKVFLFLMFKKKKGF